MKKRIIILFMAVAIFAGSCSEFLSVNEENPNTASGVPAEYILPGAINGIARTMNQPRRFEFAYLWYGLWSVSAGYSQPTRLTQYNLQNQDYQLAFNQLYIFGQNLTEVEKKSTAPQDCYYLAAAKIMKAYIFQNLVDCWGDVPYTEAFQASSNNLKPKYDKQQEIYEDLVVQLDAAMKLIKEAPIGGATPLTSTSDIIFKGNDSLWVKFANTLKLRILMHQANMDGRSQYITTNINSTVSYGYLGAGESALCNPGFLSSEGKMNPFYETFYKADGNTQSDGVTYYFAGKNAVDFYLTNNDPRIAKFYLPYATGKYAGNYFGEDNSKLTSASLTSKLGYIKDDASMMIGTASKSAPLLTDFESLFLQAEAAQRGYLTASAKDLYESAIARSFVYMGLTAVEASEYLAQEKQAVNYTMATDKMELILTQKWASLNGIAPVEIWTDYRRSGFPKGLQFSKDVLKKNDTPPVRLLYPETEISVNNDQLVKVGKIDLFSSRIFWDKE